MMPRYISASPNDIITLTSDNGDKWEGELVYDPGYEFSCDHCGTEMEDSVSGYWKNDVRYCAHCAWDLFDQPEPISAYKIWRQEKDEQEKDEQARQENERGRLQEDNLVNTRSYDWDPKLEFDDDINTAPTFEEWTSMSQTYMDNNLLQKDNLVHTRSYDWDPKPEFTTLFREYCDVKEDQVQTNDPLPSTKEELYEYLESYLEPVSIVPYDAVKLDQEFIYCDTYDEAKELLTKVTCGQDDVTQLLSDDSYNISQQHGRFWYVLKPVQDNPIKFNVSIFAKKDEIATKYLIRQLEECMYRIDYILFPEDYQYTNSDSSNWEIIQESCFICRKVNNLNLMFAFRGSRFVCGDCNPKVKQCIECETITHEKTYHNPNSSICLCFDCRFKTTEGVQMPLEEHLMVRRDIQHLRPQHFDVLVDYAALAEFTIFDAYHYKSRCHYFDCIQRIEPSEWDADETWQFCCSRHEEYADDMGCHCMNLFIGTEYDNDYEEATCKICNSPHKANVDSGKW